METLLKTLLESEGLPELIPRFVEHGITEDILVTLTDKDLREIGVCALGERRRLLRAFEAKKESTSVLAWVDGGILPLDSALAAQKVEAFMISKLRVGAQEWELIRMWGRCTGMTSLEERRGRWRGPSRVFEVGSNTKNPSPHLGDGDG